ncbi:MAG: pantoate--beta-alanine ligase, partial [Deltaproteobacteria bacterium]|nr:pantoate--beta-alanine ligase [Deltaproteobacteria bacterium]
MKTENSPLKIKEITDAIRMNGKTVGFVPTMGALHEGHLKLVEEASSATDFTVVSIFVNPTQFGPNEDFDKYPRTIEEDLLKLKKMNVDLVFIPTVKDMYGDGALTVVSVKKITDGLCGAKRENHFDGVATVVLKLFNIIGECSAFFGKKDYQQLQVIKQMVKDLNV